MKRTILTASLHLTYVFPVIGQVLPNAETHISNFQLITTVQTADNFTSGMLQATIYLSQKPATPLTIVIELKEQALPASAPGNARTATVSAPGNARGGTANGARTAGAGGGIGAMRQEQLLSDSIAIFSIPVRAPRLWSAETPYLYTVSIKLLDSSGHTKELITQAVGFSKVTMEDHDVLLNGRPLLIKGIARSKDDDMTAKADIIAKTDITAPADPMVRALQLMKQFNINAVQKGDYPDQEAWYILCDSYGLYVVDTAAESAASKALAGRHPCIILWRSGKGLDYLQPTGNALGGLKAAFHNGFILGSMSPAAWEVIKNCYQPVHTTRGTGIGTLLISNDQTFSNLSSVLLEWETLVNGKPKQKGVITLPPVQARQTGSVRLPLALGTPGMPGAPKDEVLLNLRYKLKKKEPWAPAGFVIASEQLQLKKATGEDVTVLPDGELTFKDEGGLFTVSSPSCDVQFNKQTGWMQQYAVNGIVLLDSSEEAVPAFSANFWRAPTSLDQSMGYPVSLLAWKQATREARLQLFSTSTASDIVIVKADYSLPGTQSILHVHYTVNAHGELQVEETMEADTTQGMGNLVVQDAHPAQDTTFHRPMLPRYGMRWILPAGFDSITYYGRGPFENYEDRTEASPVGIYHQTVDEQFYPYAPPQETGTKTGVRWWKITNKDGHGLLITADSTLLSMSALHYYNSDLERPALTQPRPQTQLEIDYRQMGVGGHYLLKEDHYSYQFKMTPL